jgi:hypothetical protein
MPAHQAMIRLILALGSEAYFLISQVVLCGMSIAV